MPQYQNTGTVAAPLGRFGLVPAGDTVTVVEYVDLGAGSPFVLLSSDAPWDTLHAGALPVNLSGLSNYAQIEVINTSGAAATMVANGDSARPRVIPDQNNRFLAFPGKLVTLAVTGSGTDPVYVYGDKGGMTWHL